MTLAIHRHVGNDKKLLNNRALRNTTLSLRSSGYGAGIDQLCQLI